MSKVKRFNHRILLQTAKKHVYQDYKDGFVTARLYSVMSVYSSGSFGEGSNVLKTYWAPVSDRSREFGEYTC